MNKKILKASFMFTVLTLIGKIIGMLKDVLIANYFGVSAVTDAYNIALTIPNILYTVYGSAIMITFIPNFYEVENEEGIEGAYRFSNKFLTQLLIINFVILIICMIFASELISLIAPGLQVEIKALTVKLTRITLINLIFMVITSVYSSILRSKNKFLGASLMPIVNNIPLILVLFIFMNSNTISIEIVTILITIGLAMQFLVLMPEIKKIGFKFKVTLKGYSHRIKDIVKNMIPMMIGLAVVQVSVIIDKAIGSQLSTGSITALDMSNKIITLTYGILSSTIVTIFSPILSKKFLKEDKSEWIETITDVNKYLILILVPMVVGVFILNNNLIELLYKRGSFTSENVKMVSLALMGYIMQVPFMAIRDIIGQGFYSMKNTLIPAVNGGIAVILNIILTIILSKKFGVFGITIATSISLIVGAILLLISLKRKFNIFNLNSFFRYFFKIILMSIIMGIGVYQVKINYLLKYNNFIIIAVSGVIGVGIFLVLSKIFRIKEVDNIFKMLKNKR